MAKDLFHHAVKNALIKDGWQISDDPLFLKVGGVELYIDLGTEKLIAAERNNEKIAVEIKSFINPSSLTDFHNCDRAISKLSSCLKSRLSRTQTIPSPSRYRLHKLFPKRIRPYGHRRISTGNFCLRH